MRKILFTIFLIGVALSGCGWIDSDAKLGDDANQIEMESDVGDVVNSGLINGELMVQRGSPQVKVNNDDGGELQVFILDIDGEKFDIELICQEKCVAFDILEFYAKKQGIELKIKEYDFGIFVEGIGDKIGDKNNFWLYYVNGKPANASADKVEVEPGDVIKFEWTE